MLKNLIDSMNIVLPIFLLVALGFILKKVNFLGEKFFEGCEKFVFNIALPVQLFLSVASAGGKDGSGYGKLIIFTLCSVTAAFLLGLLTVPLIIKDNAVRGAVVQNTFRSNFAILGIPLATNIAGADGRLIISIMMPFVIIMYNAYAVIELNIFAPREVKKSAGQMFVDTLKSIFTNPLIIACLIGVPFAVTGWYFPEEIAFVDRTLDYLSDSTNAMILVALGGTFSFEALKGKIKYSLPTAIYKTVVLPIVGILIAHFAFGFRDAELAALLTMFGTPSAVSSCLMAKKLKADGEVASQTLLISTILCVFTLFLGIFVLKNLGWIP